MFLFFFKLAMKLENPKLKLLDVIDTSSDKVGLVKKVLLNKDISDGVKAKALNKLTKIKLVKQLKIAIYLLKTLRIIKSPIFRACPLF